MPEVTSHIHEKYGKSQRDSIVYGDELLTDFYLGEGPYPGECKLLNFEGKQPPAINPREHLRLAFTLTVNQQYSEISTSSWPEKNNPSAQGVLLHNEEEKVFELIFRIKTSPFIPYREVLVNRIITLFNDAKEEDCVSVGIAVSSLHNFFNFLHLYPNLKCPTLSLTPEYNIYASWRADQNRLFSVHFLPGGDVRFVIFQPNTRHRDKVVRVSGIATADVLMDTVAPSGAWKWIFE